MATTKAFELAQLSALTTVDASGNVTTNTSQIANASGDLTLDSAADILLNVDGGDLRLYDDTVQFGRIANDSTDLVIEAYAADRSLLFKGLDDTTPITALTIDMSASGAATFNDQVTIGGNLIHAGNLTIDAGGDITLNADGADVILADGAVEFGRFKRDNGHLVIKSETIDKSIIIKGTTTSNAVVTALTFDMANSGRATFNENVVIQGDLTVEGSQVTLNTTALDVEDKNITLNYHASNDTSASADGAGITIQDAVNASTDASLLWATSADSWNLSHRLYAPDFVVSDTNAVIYRNSNDLELKTYAGYNINIMPAGNVGIGTESPDAKLEVAGGSTGIILSNAGDSSSYDGVSITYNGYNSGTPEFEFKPITIPGSGNVNTFFRFSTASSNGNNHANVTVDGNVGIGVPAPTVKLDVNDDTVTDNAWNTLAKFRPDLSDQHAEASIHIQSYPSTTVVADRRAGIQSIDDAGNARALILNKDGGNVGIGTDAPQSHVEIEKTGSTVFDATDTTGQAGDGATLAIQNLSDTNDTFSQILFRNRNASKAVSRIASITNGTGTDLAFVVENQGSAPSEVMRIVKSGNVGIGTDSPDSKLTVNTATTGDGIELQSSEVSIAKLSRHVVASNVVASLDGVVGRPIHIGGAINEKVILGYAGGNVGIATDTPSAFLHVKRDNNNSGNQFQVADTEGTTAGVRSYTTADGTGIIMNHYYAKSGGGNKYLRHADIVSNMGDGAAADFRFFTKDQDSNPRVAMSLSATGAIHTGAQQVRHNLQPALSLDFANSSTIDTRIQYAREGVATYFDRNGVMKYAQNNEPRIDYDPDTGECKGLLVEEQRTNWMPYPNEFGFSQWSLPGLTVFQNSGLAPDGTMSADLLIPDTSYTGRHFGYRGVTGAFLSGVTYNISCYFKAYGGFSETCKLGYRVDSDTQNGDLYGSGFQIANGEPAGNGWYRHSLTVAVGTNASFNFAEFIIGDQNGYTPTGGKGVYMWGFSVEQAQNNTGATFPTSFIPTIQRFKTRASTSATYTRSDGVITIAGQHQARYDHGLVDGVWRSKGLLLEAAATNISQNFYYPASSLRWNSGVQNATITPDVSILAPDGTYNNIVRFKETTNNAATTASVYKPISGTANTQRCFSVYAKKKELKMMRLYFDGTTPVCGQVIYNLDLGTIHIAQSPGNTDAWGIEDAGNGWWRCWFSGTVTGGQSTYYIHVDSADDFGNVSHQNTAGNGFYLWGPQMEYGGAPTSYIYTDDSAVTRALDQCDAEAHTRYGDDIKIYDLSWYNSQESTIYGEGTSISANNDTGSNPALWGLTDGTSGNRYLLRRFSNDVTNDPTYGGYTFRLQQTMPDGTGYNNDFFSPTADGLGEWDDSNVHKMAMSISPGNQIGAADGKDAQITSVTTMPAYTQPTMVQIGHAGSSDYWNGHIRKLAYYPTQLNISEMKALTETDT